MPGSRNSTTIGVRPVAPTRLSFTTSATQGANIPCHGVVLKAIVSGGTLVYVGTSSAVTSATGYPMSDGETLTFEVTNTNQLWFIAASGTQAMSVFPYLWV